MCMEELWLHSWTCLYSIFCFLSHSVLGLGLFGLFCWLFFCLCLFEAVVGTWYLLHFLLFCCKIFTVAEIFWYTLILYVPSVCIVFVPEVGS